jgi:hypothetical protein
VRVDLFSAYPATDVLTVARACAGTRTMTITSYDPDTLVATGRKTIADPPGAAVTFIAITWARDGTQRSSRQSTTRSRTSQRRPAARAFTRFKRPTHHGHHNRLRLDLVTTPPRP